MKSDEDDGDKDNDIGIMMRPMMMVLPNPSGQNFASLIRMRRKSILLQGDE